MNKMDRPSVSHSLLVVEPRLIPVVIDCLMKR